MAQKRITPVLYTKGNFTFNTPFDVSIGNNTTFTCIAIRSFAELVIKDNINVFSTYYAPNNIDEAIFSEDVSLGASIVTLQDGLGQTFYVPDTFIKTMPDMNVVPYCNIVGSVALGPLPDALDVSFLIERIKDAVKSGLGIDPIVKIHKAPTTDAISVDQHVLNETARQATITNNDTSEGRIVALQNLVENQNDQITKLTQICEDHGFFN